MLAAGRPLGPGAVRPRPCLQRLDGRQVRSSKIVMQSRIESNATNPVCRVILKEGPRPEGRQLNRSRPRNVGEIGCSLTVHFHFSKRHSSCSGWNSLSHKHLAHRADPDRGYVAVQKYFGRWAAAAVAMELAGSPNVRERFLTTCSSALFQPRKKDTPAGGQH